MYHADALIQADPPTVWAVLTDLAAWPDWGSAVARTEGSIELGSTVRIWPEVNPDRAFPVRVTELDEPRALTFRGGLPLGLFTGVRTYRLAPEGAGTRFEVREEYSGPLRPLIARTIPDLQPAFDTFAAGLKERAEAATTT